MTRLRRPALLNDGKEEGPNLRLAILEGAFTAERCQEWCHIHGMCRRTAEKEPDQKGFVVLERRWAVGPSTSSG